METLLKIKADKEGKSKKYIAFLILAIVSSSALFYALSSSSTGIPELNTDSVNIGVVTRGSIVRDVRAPGRLIPNIERLIVANFDATVVKKLLEPGAEVTEDSVIVQLGTLELIHQFRKAQIELQVAQAELNAGQEQAMTDLFEQQASVASAKAEKKQAILLAEARKKLYEINIIPQYQYRETQLEAKQAGRQLEIEQQKLKSLPKLQKSVFNVDEAKLALAKLELSLLEERVSSLTLKAGLAGILQELYVEEGQQVSQGTAIARVAGQNDLKARLNVQESQMKDIAIGQKVTIDTRITKLQGEVLRIDPAVTEGTVTVDVRITSELPKEARPDLRIDGTIEIERLDNVVYIAKPAKWRPNTQAYLFKLKDNDIAVKTKAIYGLSSASSVQLTKGFEPGDRVILSDMSTLLSNNEIQIK